MQAYVIAGGGIAGLSAAEAIRRYDPRGSITLISPESIPLYSRPMITMVLEGHTTPERTLIRTREFYEKLGVKLLAGRRVALLEPERQRVRTDRDEELAYDRLLIATGANPRRIDVPGSELEGVFYLRTMADAQAMDRWIAQGLDRALVLGGGLVGLKAAQALVSRGVGVTMLIRSPYPLSMQVDEQAGAMVRARVEGAGVEVRVGVEVEEIMGRGRVERARLSDGSTIACGMIVVGKGVVPAVDFEGAERLKVDRAVVVDRTMRTSLEGVYAAGDVAQGWDMLRNEQWVHAIWPVAVEHGRVAGANMAGARVVHPGAVGRNVIRIFGTSVASAGITRPPNEDHYQVLCGHEPRKGTYRRVVVREGRVVGMVMVGEVEQAGVMLALIQRAQPLEVPPEKLVEPGFNLARLME